MSTIYSSRTHTSDEIQKHPWNGNMTVYIPRKDISLSRLSMVALITNLWKNGVLIEYLDNLNDPNKNFFRKKVKLTKKARGIIKQLELPCSVLPDLLYLLEKITSDFVLYLDHLLSNEFFSHKGSIWDIVKNIKWDMHGGIDEVQTFKNMKYPNYHYNYIISTLYCLEDDIPRMWQNLTKIYKLMFSPKKIYTGSFDSYATFIIYYWTCRLKNRAFLIHSLEDPIGLLNEIRNTSMDLKMFVVSLNCYNIYSFKYFWYRLNDSEKKLATSIFIDIYEGDDLCSLSYSYDAIRTSVEMILFILSQIDNEQRLKVIRRCLPHMITSFWQYWQVHHVILPLFENYAGFLDPATYKALFTRLQIQNDEYTPKGKLLYRMWLSSPPHLQSLINDTERRQILQSGVNDGDRSSL